MSRRVVFNTFGSLGDLHPHLGIALGMRDRGHDVTLATAEVYREKVEATGIRFEPIRPDLPDRKDPEVMARVMDERNGPETIVKELMMPTLRQTYEDLFRVTQGADLLVSHVIPYAAQLVADKTGIPWASINPAPLCFFSSHDPSVLPLVPGLDRLRFLGRGFFGPFLWLAKRTTKSWSHDWRTLRAELGLPAYNGNPITDGIHSPQLVLAIFSRLLAEPQPDWPVNTKMTGFPYYDQDDGCSGLAPELKEFLDAGEPPIVFTLGSAAVQTAGNFYDVSARAAERLGRRAILLVGKETGNTPERLPPGVIACDYAPFTELFPRAAAIVHQGGVGEDRSGDAFRAPHSGDAILA
ncbi:MAG: glycosyltransferase [Planctomycetota bacterium]|nr:glycosyltransferase [Planctomycetota bacterium]